MSDQTWSTIGYTNTNPGIFTIKGENLRKALVERVGKHETESQQCFNEIMSILKEAGGAAAGGDLADSVARTATSLMLSLAVEDDNRLKGKALVVQSWIDRAAYLQQEILELSCIAKNINNLNSYEIDLEIALRYGLV